MRVHRRALHAVSRIGSTWESFFEPAHRVHVTTPATTSNLGPGFDSFGMAMDMSNEVIVEHADEFSITILGEGVNGNEHIPANEENVIVQSCYRAFEYMGKPVPPLRFECHNTVPALRGLGSSSSALVAGLAAGFALGGKEVYAPTVKKLILQLAADIEGHADNISAAIYGGLQVNFRSSPEGYARSGQWITQRVHLPSGLHCVLYIPDHVHQVARNSSRGALPELYTRSDCVHNIGRAAMLINCFATGQVGPSPPPPTPTPTLCCACLSHSA
jgi:homoserine kinase